MCICFIWKRGYFGVSLNMDYRSLCLWCLCVRNDRKIEDERWTVVIYIVFPLTLRWGISHHHHCSPIGNKWYSKRIIETYFVIIKDRRSVSSVPQAFAPVKNQWVTRLKWKWNCSGALIKQAAEPSRHYNTFGVMLQSWV